MSHPDDGNATSRADFTSDRHCRIAGEQPIRPRGERGLPLEWERKSDDSVDLKPGKSAPAGKVNEWIKGDVAQRIDPQGTYVIKSWIN